MPDTDSILFHSSSRNHDSDLSILVPSWNNLAYLQACVKSIRENSEYDHQIIAISNEGNEEMQKWLREQDLDHIHSDQNLGICIGLNQARKLAKGNYLLYINDDMIVLPEWDKALLEVAHSLKHNRFMLSATMVEPRETGNPAVVISNHGQDLESFDYEGLIKKQKSLMREDWNGSTWPPNMLPLSLWDEVGGMSEEFSPGMYSDPDLSMKCWKAGVRHFQGMGESLVYHFGSKSTRRLGKNIGREIFFKKWGMSSRQFYKHYLRMGSEFRGPLKEGSLPITEKASNVFKKITSRS